MSSSPDDPLRPRLDADGMIVREDVDSPPRSPLQRSPSRLLPGVVTGLGVLAAGFALAELLRTAPAPGQAPPMVPLVLASALALGGYSLTRLLQLLALVRSRARARARGDSPAPAPWGLTQQHALHGIWVVGVGASIALMGLLGLWSLLDGNSSGLEPGWPLLLVGGGIALTGRRLQLRVEALWED
jgi:hypothetical protein